MLYLIQPRKDGEGNIKTESAKLLVIQPAAGDDLDAKDLDLVGRSDGFCVIFAAYKWLKLASNGKMQPGGLHDVHMCIPKS